MKNALLSCLLFMVVVTPALARNNTAAVSTCVTEVQAEYPYPNAASAYETCQAVENMDCVDAVKKDYPYPNTATALKSCLGRINMDCVNAVKADYPYPNTATASDGGVREFGVGVPHPRSYGNNARVLAEYVRNRHVLTLEDAIRRMTTLPARTFRFEDRGIVREGAAADLLVFDPARVQDKATFQQPHQYSEGFDYVLVNGKVEVEDGKLTETRAGQVLRHAM